MLTNSAGATVDLQSFHLRGASTADAVIATVTVILSGDGTLRFTDAAGDLVIYNGDDEFVNRLLTALLVGTNGLPAGTKLFGAF